MPRQYRILHRHVADPPNQFRRLRPKMDGQIYDRAEVRVAIGFMRDNPTVEGIAVRLDDELFNIISFTQEAEAPLSFPFPS